VGTSPVALAGGEMKGHSDVQLRNDTSLLIRSTSLATPAEAPSASAATPAASSGDATSGAFGSAAVCASTETETNGGAGKRSSATPPHVCFDARCAEGGLEPNKTDARGPASSVDTVVDAPSVPADEWEADDETGKEDRRRAQWEDEEWAGEEEEYAEEGVEGKEEVDGRATGWPSGVLDAWCNEARNRALAEKSPEYARRHSEKRQQGGDGPGPCTPGGGYGGSGTFASLRDAEGWSELPGIAANEDDLDSPRMVEECEWQAWRSLFAEQIFPPMRFPERRDVKLRAGTLPYGERVFAGNPFGEAPACPPRPVQIPSASFQNQKKTRRE
jgi:hypothetical protein